MSLMRGACHVVATTLAVVCCPQQLHVSSHAARLVPIHVSCREKFEAEFAGGFGTYELQLVAASAGLFCNLQLQ